LTSDPFIGTEALAQLLELDVDLLRVRLHDALISADRVVCLGGPAFDAVAPLVSRKPEDRMFPPTALNASPTAKGAILVVNNEDEAALQELMSLLVETFPLEEFCAFDPATALDTAWKAVVQIGVACSSMPGARLSDAWAGNVPVLQIVDRTSLMARNRRQGGGLSEVAVEHGKTGLLFSGTEELVSALRDLLLDPLPARSVARGARRRIDPAAQWDILLKAVLQ